MAERSPKKIYLSILVTLLLLIFFHYVGWLNFFEKMIRQTMGAILSQTHSLSVGIKNQSDYENLNSECRNEYEQIVYWQKQNEITFAQLKILEQENGELKKILNFYQQSTYQVVAATTIGKGSDNAERVLTISSGSDQGVKLNQPVVALDGILVGKVIKVSQNTSWVRLINDANSKIAATILNEEKSQGVVEGGYGLSVNMNFIPRNEKIAVGETVVTSGLDEDVPKGLLLGTVAAVVNETYQPFQKAVLNPAVDLAKITTVGIIVGNK